MADAAHAAWLDLALELRTVLRLWWDKTLDRWFCDLDFVFEQEIVFSIVSLRRRGLFDKARGAEIDFLYLVRVCLVRSSRDWLFCLQIWFVPHNLGCKWVWLVANKTVIISQFDHFGTLKIRSWSLKLSRQVIELLSSVVRWFMEAKLATALAIGVRELHVLSIDLDSLLAQVLYDAPDFFQIKSVRESRKKMLQKSVSEKKHSIDLSRRLGADRILAIVKVIVANLVMDFLENVANRCEGNWNVFLARDIILAQRVVEDWEC